MKEKRFNDKDRKTPGPGAYSIEKYYEVQDRKVNGVLAKDSRFPEENTEFIPGPGYYDNTKQRVNHHQNPSDFPCAFGSGTLKNNPFSSTRLETPGPGYYDNKT